MNDQRSDDDRRADGPDPEETDERTATPEEEPETAPDRGAEPEDTATPDTEAEPGTGAGEGAAAQDAERAATDSGDATSPDTEGAEGSGVEDTGSPEGDGPGAGESGDGDAGTQATAAAGPPRRGAAGWVVALALLIALAAAGAAGYLGWRLYELERRVATIPEEREAALEPLAERSALESLDQKFEQRLQAAVDEKAESLISERDEALGEVRERVGTLESGVEDIRELAARDQIDWRLAEIRYLLAIAQRRVLIDSDVRSAIAALESADRAIGEFGDVRLLPLRQRIVDDLSALRSAETADIEGIALRVQNLLGRVPELPAAGTQTTVEASEENEKNGTGSWWERVVARLDDFVTVRRREAGPEAGRPQPATELPEGDRLVLALERARSAALVRDPSAYERALTRASEMLDEGFAKDARATERFREGLDWLREQPVEVDLPDLEPTVDLAERLSARIESSRKDESADDSDEAED
ncbi:MAG: uroporphyrinogen-III C-methyltransferase [Halofilum sp. (in: g-proteobacteria)]